MQKILAKSLPNPRKSAQFRPIPPKSAQIHPNPPKSAKFCPNPPKFPNPPEPARIHPNLAGSVSIRLKSSVRGVPFPSTNSISRSVRIRPNPSLVISSVSFFSSSYPYSPQHIKHLEIHAIPKIMGVARTSMISQKNKHTKTSNTQKHKNQTMHVNTTEVPE